MSSDFDIAKCYEFAKELTLRAGEIIKCAFESEKILYQKEGEWNQATDVDHKVEKLFIDELSKKFPDHKIIAEETVSAMQEQPELTDAPTWCIDPIDGTMNFIHTLPLSSISVGLTVCKEPVLGIIYNPMTSEFYSAIKGQGAFLNGKRIWVSKVKELKKAIQVFEPSILYISCINRPDIFIGRMNALVAASKGIRSMGSVALTMAFVARGALDCMYVDGLAAWDVVAGIVIVNEAGGTIMETKGGVYNIMKPNTIAASTESLAREISELIIETDSKLEKKWLENQMQCKKETKHVE